MSEVIWARPASLTGQALVAALRAELSGRVERAYLFGSHVRGKATSFSDVDLILVHETVSPWPDRAQAFLDVAKRFAAVDLLVYTPSEWEEIRARPTPFIREVSQDWVQVC